MRQKRQPWGLRAILPQASTEYKILGKSVPCMAWDGGLLAVQAGCQGTTAFGVPAEGGG